jgi:ribonuclease HI
MASMAPMAPMAPIASKPIAPKQIPFDQPRAADGQRLLYKYPNLPTVGKGTAIYNLLVGSSDKSATAWLLQFDGAANPNPGPASAGAVLWSPQDAQGKRSPVFEMGKFIGKNTNNVAEIQGLLLGLKMAVMRNARDLLIEGDSELIINQQIGKYKVSHKNLKVWWSEIQAAMMDETSFDWIAIRHVYRECNERADSITKEVLSKKQSFTR